MGSYEIALHRQEGASASAETVVQHSLPLVAHLQNVLMSPPQLPVPPAPATLRNIRYLIFLALFFLCCVLSFLWNLFCWMLVSLLCQYTSLGNVLSPLLFEYNSLLCVTGSLLRIHRPLF